jgi:hypothetical protein
LIFLLKAMLVADIATNMVDPRGTVRLFYPKGDQIVSAQCAAGETLYDRATCKDDVRAVPAQTLFDRMAAEFGGGQAALEMQLGSVETAINRVDAKIWEIEATPAGASGEALKHDVSVAQQGLAAKDAEIHELDELIAHLLADMGDPPDPEAVAQYQDDQRTRAKKLQERSVLADQLLAARERYVAAGTAADPELFEGLKAEHQRLAQNRVSIRQKIDVALDEAIRLRTLFQRLRDDFVFLHLDFPVVYRDSNLPVYGRDSNFNSGLDWFFRQYDYELRHFATDVTPGTATVEVDVTRTGLLKQVTCSLDYRGERDDTCGEQWFDVEDPTGRKLRFRGPSFHVNDGINNNRDGAGYAIDPAWFVDRPAQGVWTFALSCNDGRQKAMDTGSCSILID